MSELPTPEQQLVANQQLLKILPFVLGFGWVVMIPISYLFIAPVVSNDLGVQIGVTVGIVVATGIADLVFLKIMTHNVESMMRQLEVLRQLHLLKMEMIGMFPMNGKMEGHLKL